MYINLHMSRQTGDGLTFLGTRVLEGLLIWTVGPGRRLIPGSLGIDAPGSKRSRGMGNGPYDVQLQFITSRIL